MSTIFTLRVPKRLREAMKRYADRADWPEYLRQVIAQKVKQLELEEASKVANRVRSRTEFGKYDSVETIRRDRGR